MAVFACTPTGVAYLKKFVYILGSSKCDFIRIANTLIDASKNNLDLIGPHINFMQEMIYDLNSSIEGIEEMCNKINELIDKYQEIIDEFDNFNIDVDA